MKTIREVIEARKEALRKAARSLKAEKPDGKENRMRIVGDIKMEDDGELSFCVMPDSVYEHIVKKYGKAI